MNHQLVNPREIREGAVNFFSLYNVTINLNMYVTLVSEILSRGIRKESKM